MNPAPSKYKQAYLLKSRKNNSLSMVQGKEKEGAG